MKRYLTLLLLATVLLPPRVLTQAAEAALLDQRSRFQDGVYFSFAALRANRPDLTWDALDGSLVHNPEDFITKVEWLRPPGSTVTLSLDTVWAVVLEGLPYLRTPPAPEQKAKFTTFAGLRVRGRICFFDYEIMRTRLITMSAYNPVTGRPFRTGQVPKQETAIVEKILHWDTGEIVDFTKGNLLAWVSDDEMLYETVAALTEAEAEEKLFKCLLIYVDRNEAYLGVE